LAALPSVKFTSDSVYRNESILDMSVLERKTVEIDDASGEIVSEDKEYVLCIAKNYVLGYDVYDNPETPHIDGIKVNDAFLSEDWDIPNFDLDSDYTVTVKTVYSDDIAGWLARAKDGDFSAVLSNPVMLLQFVYYIMAAVSIILGGFGVFKSRKSKAKTASEIASAVAVKAGDLELLAAEKIREVEDRALNMVEDVCTPMMSMLSKQNDTLIQATVLARNGDEQSTLALLELLKNSGAANTDKLAEDVKAKILASRESYEKSKADAVKAMQEAVSKLSGSADDEKHADGYDGTSI